MTSPTISVVMSIYNEPEDWLRASIESILNQSFSDLEFIIVNDNPDRLINKQILDYYTSIDQRIVRSENVRNFGLTYSLNKGFHLAKGQYIARMDADDISYPDRLALQFRFMEEHPNVGVCGAWIKYFGDISFFTKRLQKMPCTPKEVLTAMLFTNPIIHPTAFIRKVILDTTHDIYDESYRNAQDYVLWDNLSSQSIQLANVGKVLLKYRVSSLQISNTLKSNQLSVASTIQHRLLIQNCKSLDKEDKLLLLTILNKKEALDPSQFDQFGLLLKNIRKELKSVSSFSNEWIDKRIHVEWISCFQRMNSKTRLWIPFFFSNLLKLRYLSFRELVKTLFPR